jgi:coproporphyrinogen III oxidase
VETEEEKQRKKSAIKDLLEQICDDVDPMDENWGNTEDETGSQSKSGSGMTEVVI